MDYEPCICPWCDQVLLNTTAEAVRLRFKLYLEHVPHCPSRRPPDVPEGGYSAGIVRLLRGEL